MGVIWTRAVQGNKAVTVAIDGYEYAHGRIQKTTKDGGYTCQKPRISPDV